MRHAVQGSHTYYDTLSFEVVFTRDKRIALYGAMFENLVVCCSRTEASVPKGLPCDRSNACEENYHKGLHARIRSVSAL